MTGEPHQEHDPDDISRRSVLLSTLAAAGGSVLASARAEAADRSQTATDPLRASAKTYTMKKSINLWAFPYPARMSLKECLQLAKRAGFDAVELNYDLENDLSPRSGTAEFQAIRRMADEIGIAISGICSFLYWPYSLTDSDPARRARGLELASKMIHAAHDLGTENLLTIAGSVSIPWIPDREPVPFDVCDRRAKEAIRTLLPLAEKLGVFLNIENIFFNGYLTSPMEMNAFVDSFANERVRVHFDTGNIMLFQSPEYWIPILGSRIKNIHFKEFNKKGTDHTLESFRTLLDGTTDWPAVLEALAAARYEGHVTFEYFHPFSHYPEALIYQTSDALDRILGRRA